MFRRQLMNYCGFAYHTGNKMKLFYCLTFVVFYFGLTLGLEIRLWPVNARGNEGFVEVYHEGTWGLIGSPTLRFSDATSRLLCKTLGLSDFGYSSGWTSIDNYGGSVWTYNFECHGNETDLDQCKLPDVWKLTDYSNQTDWGFRHGTRLYCVDAQIKDGPTQNTGTIEASLDGNTYALCYDGMDMNAANVVCNHLGYDGALSIDKAEPRGAPIYDKNVKCSGCEYSLKDCDRSVSLYTKCYDAAVVTCKAFRIARMSRYIDEGPVEVFYNGSWGFVGNPGASLDDQTASYLCKRFGISDVGFSTTGRSLQTYARKSWLSWVSCLGNETDVMQCNRSMFSVVPTLMHTYRRGTWLYCFRFYIQNIRLSGGLVHNEGRVELNINGRWGSISTYGMKNIDKDKAATTICKQLGYRGFEKVFHDGSLGRNDDLFWMSEVACRGNESAIDECYFTKGPITMTYNHPVYLKIRCHVENSTGSAQIVG